MGCGTSALKDEKPRAKSNKKENRVRTSSSCNMEESKTAPSDLEHEKKAEEEQMKKEVEDKARVEREKEEIRLWEENEKKAREEDDRLTKLAIEKQRKEEEATRLAQAQAMALAKKSQKFIATGPAPPRHTGYMSKQGQVFKTWKRRFFQLEDGELTYYLTETEEGSGVGEQRMGVPLHLRGYQVQVQNEKFLLISEAYTNNRRMTMDGQGIASPRNRAVSTVEANMVGKSRSMLLQVKAVSELKKWEEAINKHIQYCDSLELAQ